MGTELELNQKGTKLVLTHSGTKLQLNQKGTKLELNYRGTEQDINHSGIKLELNHRNTKLNYYGNRLIFTSTQTQHSCHQSTVVQKITKQSYKAEIQLVVGFFLSYFCLFLLKNKLKLTFFTHFTFFSLLHLYFQVLK